MKIAVGNKDIKYYIFLLPLFKPMGLTELYSTVDVFYDTVRVFVFIFVLMNMLRKFKPRFKLKRPCLSSTAVLYRICICIAFFRVGNLSACFGTVIVCLSGIFVILYLGEKNVDKLVKVCSEILFVLINLDLGLYFIYPHGLNSTLKKEARINFLCIDNNYIWWVLVAFFILYIYKERDRRGRVLYYIIMTESTVAIILRSSTTSKAVWILVLIFLFMKKISFVRKEMNFRNVMVFLGLMNFGLVVLNVQSYIGGIIYSLTGKGSDFTTRVTIWATMKRLIVENPIWGTGSGKAVIDAWIRWNEIIYYSHNMVLDILVKGGIVALLGFLLVLIVWNTKIAEMRQVYDKYYFICILVFLAFGIAGFMEGFEDSILLWIFLAGSYLISDVCINEKVSYID